MIYIRYDKPNKQVITKYSAYISFNYNPHYVDFVKSLDTRYWDPINKQWEIPTSLVSKLVSYIPQFTELNDLPDNKVEIDNYVFKTDPFPYQKDGVIFGIEHNSFILGDEQGLGKTKQMIDLACYKKQYEGIKHCLIVCGVNSLKENWINEVKKHSNETAVVLGRRYKPKAKRWEDGSMEDRLEDLNNIPDQFFWVTNIETLRTKRTGSGRNSRYNSDIVNRLNDLIKKGELGMIVVDEIHKCKDPNSAQGRGLLRLKGCSKIGLSGTILVNSPLDLYTPLAFIEALNQSFYYFKLDYCLFDVFGGVTGYKNMERLRPLINTHMLRRRKDLLNLPEKFYQEEYLELSENEKRLYSEILSETKMECDKISNPVAMLAKLTRLRQLCCHTGLISTKVVESTKFNRLKDILEEAKNNNEKVIVFSMFREVIEMAMEEFKDYDPLHLWGQMRPSEIEDQKHRFQEEDGFKVLFGVISAAGTGHTLSEASIVIFLDLPWNKATMEQAEDRAHRIGTKKSVLVLSLLTKGTYEEVLFRKIISKGSMGEVLVNGKDINEMKKFIQEVFEGGDFEYEDNEY